MTNIIDRRTSFPALDGVSYGSGLTISTCTNYNPYGPKELYLIELFDDSIHFYFREESLISYGTTKQAPRISKEIWDMQDGTLKCRKTIYGTYHPAQSEYYTFENE